MLYFYRNLERLFPEQIDGKINLNLYFHGIGYDNVHVAYWNSTKTLRAQVPRAVVLSDKTLFITMYPVKDPNSKFGLDCLMSSITLSRVSEKTNWKSIFLKDIFDNVLREGQGDLK